MSKPRDLSLDLGLFDEADKKKLQVVKRCTHSGGREPPLLPNDFEAQLETKTFTNGKDDKPLVARLYRDAFAVQMRNVSLDYSQLGWGVQGRPGTVWDRAARRAGRQSALVKEKVKREPRAARAREVPCAAMLAPQVALRTGSKRSWRSRWVKPRLRRGPAPPASSSLHLIIIICPQTQRLRLLQNERIFRAFRPAPLIRLERGR